MLVLAQKRLGTFNYQVLAMSWCLWNGPLLHTAKNWPRLRILGVCSGGLFYNVTTLRVSTHGAETIDSINCRKDRAEEGRKEGKKERKEKKRKEKKRKKVAHTVSSS